jgi:hypothetical protein
MTSAETQPITRKTRLTRRRFWTWLFVGLGLLAVVFAVIFKVMYLDDVPLRISRETTLITEPLTADGRVDYVAATEPRDYPPEMATDDNGFRLIVRQLGPSAPQHSEQRRQTCEKLGLDPDVSPTLGYEQPYDFLMRHCEAEDAAGNLPAKMDANQFELQIELQMQDPWTLEEFPMMADWLTQNEPALDLVSEAVRKPVFCIPCTSSAHANGFAVDFLECVEIGRIVQFARGFQARARFRLGTGDVEGAIDDIVACARMGRHLQNGGFRVECQVGIYCQSVAYSIGAGGSLEHQPTEAQWRRLLGELNRLPEREEAADIFEIERMTLLDSIQSIAWGEISILASWAKPLQVRDYGIDWNIVMQRANERYDELVAGAGITKPDKSSLEGYMSRARRSHLLGDYLSSAILWRDPYVESRRRVACTENMLRIVLAMLIFEKQHGTLPPAYSADDKGVPLHSWRVLLLPYLGYDELHANIRLNEPWDSPHNQQFHAADVPIFECPSAAHGAGMTNYSVVEGPTCAFDGSEGKRLDAFGPRSAHLVLIVERTNSVNWMDPSSELTFADAHNHINRPGVNGIGSEHEGGVHYGQRSGGVRFISESMDFMMNLQLIEGTIERPY